MQSKEIKGIQEAYALIYESAPTSPADAVGKVNKKNFPAPKPLEESDIFDIIKGYLIDESFAETEEAALAIMSNMSEEWRESIVEAIGGPIGGALKAYSNAARPLFSGLPRGRTVDADAAFKAGGGNAKMKQTGMSRAEVQRLGAKNMK